MREQDHFLYASQCRRARQAVWLKAQLDKYNPADPKNGRDNIEYWKKSIAFYFPESWKLGIDDSTGVPILSDAASVQEAYRCLMEDAEATIQIAESASKTMKVQNLARAESLVAGMRADSVFGRVSPSDFSDPSILWRGSANETNRYWMILSYVVNAQKEEPAWHEGPGHHPNHWESHEHDPHLVRGRRPLRGYLAEPEGHFEESMENLRPRRTGTLPPPTRIPPRAGR